MRSRFGFMPVGRNAIIFILLVFSAPAVLRATVLEATLVRLKACDAIRPDYDRIAVELRDDPGFLAYQSRLRKLDATASSLLADLEGLHDSFIQQSTAAVGVAHTSVASGSIQKRIGALALFVEAEPEWRSPPPLPADDAKTRVLAAYFNTGLMALVRRVQETAQHCVGVGGDTQEVVRLAFVLPLLATSDAEWADSTTDALPAWMRRPERAKAMENLALHASRPRTAFLLDAHLLAARTQAAGLEAFIPYLWRASDGMCREKDFPAAINCLKAAETIDGAAARVTSVDAHFRIAEIDAQTGSFESAAAEAKQVLTLPTEPNVHGKAAMLRLRYMCEAKQYAGVTREATAFEKDAQCASYLPHILYIAWVAEHRSGNSAAQKQWRDDFLARFPDHPLGAPIYYAAAMDALGAGEPDRAIQLLEFIEHRYPNASNIDTVRDMNVHLKLLAQKTREKSQPEAGTQ